jgi:hypothetical protein
MIQKKSPGPAVSGADERASKLSANNIPLFTSNDKHGFMANLSQAEFEALAAGVRRENRKYSFVYNRRQFKGAYYYERCFLSCLLAGAAIPKGITAQTLLIPRHRIILEAICKLEVLGIRGNLEALLVWLKFSGLLKKAGGGDYIREIESVVGVPSAITAFAVEIRRLVLERLQA